jgi:predicted DNA-binding protein (MmcQ/YjbR family)
MPADPLPRIRELCTAFPETTEKLSHGQPTWFARGRKSFLMSANRHHDDRLGSWCAAGPGAQHVLVQAKPANFFVPPYVGYRGWLGVWLDVPVDWDEVAGIIAEAHATVAATLPQPRRKAGSA